jgi:Tfp pilus assembly protein PilO
MMWRERRVLLAILGVLLAANTFFFFTYRLQYEERLKELEDRRDQAQARLTQQRSTRVLAERRLAAYRAISKDVADIYTRQWSTEDQRLTALISEVKRLAIASELVPKSISYQRVAPHQQKGMRTNAEIVTISFSVQGNYQQVRRLINLFELSRQFIIIDQIALNSAQNDTLSLNLQLKTLFRDTSPAREL